LRHDSPPWHRAPFTRRGVPVLTTADAAAAYVRRCP
jgi:hypothetical protein